MFLFSDKDDIDKVIIRGMELQHIRQICGGFVDLASAACRSRDASDLGLCIVSSPAYIFIAPEKKGALSNAFSTKLPDRFLPITDRPSHFLSTSQPRKMHVQTVIEALVAADIAHVNVLMYGCKTSWPYFLWLGDIGDADVELDIGHMLTLNPPGIHLARKAPGVDVGGFRVTMWPMLTTYQRDTWYGSMQFESPDPSHPINGIIAVKVYPALTHVVKGLATQNFMTMPETVWMACTRRSQTAQLLRLLELTDYGPQVNKVRVEVTLKLNRTLGDMVEVARQVGRDICQTLEWRTVTYAQYTQELRRMLDLAGHLRYGVGDHNSRLSQLQSEFGAHLLNAAGVSTLRIITQLRTANADGRYRWEPVAAAEPEPAAQDSADDFEPVGPRPFPAHVAPTAPLPPAWVPVTLGVGPQQRR